MIDVNPTRETLPIPSLVDTRFTIDPYGTLYYNRTETTLEYFNEATGLEVSDVNVLVLVTYQSFNWGPGLWKHLEVLYQMHENLPENMILRPKYPVESNDFPGFYEIPYYGNYVISKQAKVLRKLDGTEVVGSLALNNYYTVRVKGDNRHTSNQLRHRIMGLAFLKYLADPSELQINHKNLVPGDDVLENLEWCTPIENVRHAISNGAIPSPGTEIQIRDMATDKVYIFSSYSQGASFFKLSSSTVCRLAKQEGLRPVRGLQIRHHPCDKPWPDVEQEGKFKVTFPNGDVKMCNGYEAARHAGVTYTSLTRLLREGRNQGTTDAIIERLEVPT